MSANKRCAPLPCGSLSSAGGTRCSSNCVVPGRDTGSQNDHSPLCDSALLEKGRRASMISPCQFSLPQPLPTHLTTSIGSPLNQDFVSQRRGSPNPPPLMYHPHQIQSSLFFNEFVLRHRSEYVGRNSVNQKVERTYHLTPIGDGAVTIPHTGSGRDAKELPSKSSNPSVDGPLDFLTSLSMEKERVSSRGDVASPSPHPPRAPLRLSAASTTPTMRALFPMTYSSRPPYNRAPTLTAMPLGGRSDFLWRHSKPLTRPLAMVQRSPRLPPIGAGRGTTDDRETSLDTQLMMMEEMAQCEVKAEEAMIVVVPPSQAVFSTASLVTLLPPSAASSLPSSSSIVQSQQTKNNLSCRLCEEASCLATPSSPLPLLLLHEAPQQSDYAKAHQLPELFRDLVAALSAANPPPSEAKNWMRQWCEQRSAAATPWATAAAEEDEMASGVAVANGGRGVAGPQPPLPRGTPAARCGFSGFCFPASLSSGSPAVDQGLTQHEKSSLGHPVVVAEDMATSSRGRCGAVGVLASRSSSSSSAISDTVASTWKTTVELAKKPPSQFSLSSSSSILAAPCTPSPHLPTTSTTTTSDVGPCVLVTQRHL